MIKPRKEWKLILRAIKDHALAYQDIAAETGLPESEVLRDLILMEGLQWVDRVTGGIYTATDSGREVA